MLERRQGSGTFLVRPPESARLAAGLERPETYTVHAGRTGLKLADSDLAVDASRATSDEAADRDGYPCSKPTAEVCIPMPY